MKRCEECGGSGSIYVRLQGAPFLIEANCNRCYGKGQVEEQHEDPDRKADGAGAPAR